MKLEQQQRFLVSFAYWAIIAAAVYLAFAYVVPISVPFIIGILVARFVVWLSCKLHCRHRLFRIGLAVLIYGTVGTLVVLLAIKGVTSAADLVKLLPGIYQNKVLPLAELAYQWGDQTIQNLDPALDAALGTLLEGLLSSAKNFITFLTGFAVDLVSGLATGVPSLILSLLAMIFSTVFVVSDYERISQFTAEHLPPSIRNILDKVKTYLTDTLFVVIRSYALIMLLTFTELSILFSVFGIQQAVLKASLIAVLDIMPILGTGGIMIPWSIISFVLGDISMGIRLLVIYAIVTVIRNYLEPKIVGTQLGLHPIITLIAMFIGLRLFGFWGLFGLPVGISFLWKQRNEAAASPPQKAE